MDFCVREAIMDQSGTMGIRLAAERSMVSSSLRANTVGPPTLIVAGQELTLFEEASPLIDAMMQDISTAQTRVWLESYIIADDAAGRAVANALCERAAAGVAVKVIYDAVGSLSTPSAFFVRLRQAGVRVSAYHKFTAALWRLSLLRRMLRRLNRRDHRKLLLIDDHIAYFGGMNIVDQSGIRTQADARARHLPASAGWRDVHVRLVGPQQKEIAAAFDSLWRRVRHRKVKPASRWPVQEMLASEQDTLWFFDSRPSLRDRRPQRVFVPLIQQARRSITVSMAYFVPVGEVLRELVRALKRGVIVRVIVPAESDVKLVRWATRHTYAYLLARGFRLFERRDLMLHSKVLMIDDAWTVVGSCNLDARSLWMNLEFFAVIHSRAVNTAVKRICRADLRNSKRITFDHDRRRPWWQRLLDWMAWRCRYWL